MTRHQKGLPGPLTAAVLAAAALLTAPLPAAAHHMMGGRTPTRLLEGLLSGLGHPVIGIDHLAFTVAVGVACACLAARYVLPAVFVAATVAGCLLRTAGGIELPATEIAVAGSLVLLGAPVMGGAALGGGACALLFAAAGLVHGAAYAEAIVGAEPTPLLAYLAGFGLVQYAIAVGAMWLARRAGQAASAADLAPRLIGALVAGIGVALVFERIEAVVFAV
ncbi:MAG TPA: HupE/UreJ family protein [Hyphomicrobiaceae bacterium]|nr:HupE/UreJ family protein [Hyphomicrobiaceae bacterium]